MKNIFRVLRLSMLFFLVSCTHEDKVEFVNGETGQVENPDPFSAKKIIADMGPGFNLGNTFDNGIHPTSLSAIKPVIDLYKNAGMKHIRIPTTWMDRFASTLADNNGNINVNHPRFLELKAAIDYALSQDLYVILNTHHESWLKDHYDGSEQYDSKFRTLWTGIATYFKDYPQKLIFEVLNEPEGNLGELDGNGPFPDPTDALALQYTRKVNQVGYEAIRATHGNNEKRLIMVGTNGQGNALYISNVYPSKSSLPGGGNDNYLSIQVHTYSPWAFCGETGSNAAFPGTASFETGIQNVKAHSIKLNVPVHYGEFGVGRSSNAAERNTDLVRNYYRTMARTTLAQSMSYSVWDDRGWFALINPTGTSFVNNIVPYMLQ
ncbi:glycoside hydrolase family 5 protein [Epilithonimonas zeae]|uniref:glycoside hydrolase family 5 protein n=1 Tax=Epilithonimonas zeae TaxID=1416779 RepID=UPI00200BCD56|nr:glycoside hydrolase family 5 protein [Epilithonimonas zeae]UQB69068.1 glycoside hydrolase family 5 protein [Epilithonimonas zeae]